MDKNWFWHNDYKIPNGVHAWGRSYNPFGPDNYPHEIEKIRQMTANRDTMVWVTASNFESQNFNLTAADKRTPTLPPVKTNFNPEANGSLTYLYGQDALDKLKTPPATKLSCLPRRRNFRTWPTPCR